MQKNPLKFTYSLPRLQHAKFLKILVTTKRRVSALSIKIIIIDDHLHLTLKTEVVKSSRSD